MDTVLFGIFGEKIHLSNNIQKLHKIGFSVRISCVMIDGYIDNLRDVQEFVGWCKTRNVEQFTIRPVTNISYEETKDDDIKKEIIVFSQDSISPVTMKEIEGELFHIMKVL